MITTFVTQEENNLQITLVCGKSQTEEYIIPVVVKVQLVKMYACMYTNSLLSTPKNPPPLGCAYYPHASVAVRKHTAYR